uniref:odorant receptor 22c-like n=1 Tax=Bombus vancouverensis nearcticus TaxID=2705178 RepID=UPI001439E14B|nr:odorant receptor 22c-like [Bombus vancouverensis nearcticus]
MREKVAIEEYVRNFLVQETLLKVVGIWPTRNGSSFGRWIFAMMTQISTIYSLSLEVYRHCLDIDDTMDAFVMDLSSIVSLAKLFIMRRNSKHAYVLINSVLKDWSAVDDSRHEDIMTKYYKRGRIVSLTILYLGYASGLSFIVKALPFGEILPFKMFQNSANSSANLKGSLEMNYFLASYCVFGSLPLLQQICVLILQAMHIFVNAVAHCANDGLFFSLTMHLCGQFEVLKMNFTKFELQQFGYHKKLRFLVKRHCQLLMLANDLEQTFNMIILVQLLMSALLICVEGFVFLVCLATRDNVGALKSVVLMVTLLIQLYLYAYAGDVLESRSNEIAHGVYDSPWYQPRGHVARDLMMIINRGHRSYHVTAGKFLSMNMFTFKEILRSSASYLSVLKVMMDT